MRVLGIIFLFIFSYQSHAVDTLIEMRVHYGVDLTNKKDELMFNLHRHQESPKSHHGFGADAFVTLPTLPNLGLGLRYSFLQAKIPPTLYRLSTSTLALLANYRIIDAQFFIGVVGTFGVMSSFKLKRPLYNLPSRADQIDTANKKRFYSIGLEGGSYIDQFLVGIEGGYQVMTAHDWRLKPYPEYPAKTKWNNSGLYLKAMIGTSFN